MFSGKNARAGGDTLPWLLTSAPASSSSRTMSSTPSRQAGRLRSRVCKGPPPSLAPSPAASLTVAPPPLSLAPSPLKLAPPPSVSLAPSPAAESGGRRLRGQCGVSSQCSRSCDTGKWTQQSAKEKKIRTGVIFFINDRVTSPVLCGIRVDTVKDNYGMAESFW